MHNKIICCRFDMNKILKQSKMSKITTTITTQKQREVLKEKTQIELLKRGFTAKLNEFVEIEKRGAHYIEFQSENFQTTPVIFEQINISNFSTSVKKEERQRENGAKYTLTTFWIQVSCRYKSFSGGTNGQNLFDISGNFYEDEERINEYSIF